MAENESNISSNERAVVRITMNDCEGFTQSWEKKQTTTLTES